MGAEWQLDGSPALQDLAAAPLAAGPGPHPWGNQLGRHRRRHTQPRRCSTGQMREQLLRPKLPQLLKSPKPRLLKQLSPSRISSSLSRTPTEQGCQTTPTSPRALLRARSSQWSVSLVPKPQVRLATWSLTTSVRCLTLRASLTVSLLPESVPRRASPTRSVCIQLHRPGTAMTSPAPQQHCASAVLRIGALRWERRIQPRRVFAPITFVMPRLAMW
mmetsp:Transcript_71998/g.119265  ORF Transcript_71998/g.119265 Transcript_71998/m.119265 type:complete len:217 (+) Transcript_71998:126-776(+)